ncbi:hypothetical protein Taro_017147 [Colocasia esculenta]|uniref:Uncharacterized protein n=1 Tax=Colocasia esculenta TaxID=4460 RepID=A0A843UQN5_COLES|nr:hypothetical protein [Colocasia esculenta]
MARSEPTRAGSKNEEYVGRPSKLTPRVPETPARLSRSKGQMARSEPTRAGSKNEEYGTAVINPGLAHQHSRSVDTRKTP